jgi:hypothetical protein
MALKVCVQILYHSIQFDTDMWLWHVGSLRHFDTLGCDPWQDQNFDTFLSVLWQHSRTFTVLQFPFLPHYSPVYRPCHYITFQQRSFSESPLPVSVPVFSELSADILCVPECAAHVRALSKFRGASGGPVRPSLRSSKTRTRVQGRPRSPFLRLSVAY